MTGFRCGMHPNPGVLAAGSGPGSRSDPTARVRRVATAVSPWPKPGARLPRALSRRPRICSCGGALEDLPKPGGMGNLGGEGIRAQPVAPEGSGVSLEGLDELVGPASPCSLELLLRPWWVEAPRCRDSRYLRHGFLRAGSGVPEGSLRMSADVLVRASGQCGGCSRDTQTWLCCLRSRRPLVGFPQRTWPGP